MNTLRSPIAAGKTLPQAAWLIGDFGAFAPYTEAGDDQVARQAQVRPGEPLLDAACGAGAFALRAARTGAQVTGMDIAPHLIEQARTRAREAGLEVQFDEGDVEALPYPEAAFDAVVSQFGVMFAPRPDVAVAELARVLKPGGRVALFCWTPSSWVGQLWRVIARHVPPPPGAPAPLAWGVEAAVRERLAPHFTDLRTWLDAYRMQFPFGPLQVLDFFLRNLGPVGQAYASLGGTEQQAALRAGLELFFIETNQGDPGTWQVASQYLGIEARKR